MRARATALCAALAVAFAALSAHSQQPQTTLKRDGAVSFAADVMPLLSRFGCNRVACHGSSKGKGGLRLSLFGAYPEEDYAAITRSAPGRWINSVESQKSLLLLKVTGATSHPGATKVRAGSPEHVLLASWAASGAPWGDDTAPALASVEVTPPAATLRQGESLPLQTSAVYADGTRRDVTHSAQYRSANTDVAEVDQTGRIKTLGPGDAVIIVTYMRQPAVVRLAVPQSLPMPFPDVPTAGRIDALVLDRLKTLGIPPSEFCSDEAFLRRVYLDVIGILPTPDEAKAFLSDRDPKKRARLIDVLLERDEYADFWALKWGDLLRIKSEYPSNLWPNGVQAYYRWVRHSLAVNKPYDQFVRELLVSSGSNFRSPPANYYRALRKRDAQGYAESTALVFMGARLGCARCHGHPTESWTLEDNLGMAAFFPQVRIKSTGEWKEEIVYVDPKQVLTHPVTRELIAPRPLGGEVVELAEGEDRREKFAAWLISADNTWFTANIVNRIWFWLFERGIVHEVDDMRPTNPPTNPELLACLQTELVDHKYDLKHIYRLILNSRTYQLSSVPNPFNAKDVSHFSHYRARRLGAEQLLDAVNQVTETFDKYESRIPEPYTVLPDGHRAAQLADGSIPDKSGFLELFGRPPRDTAYEGDRSSETSMRQALHLINSSDVAQKISRSPRLQRLFKEKKSDDEIVDEIYLAALSRFPTKEEKQKVTAYIARDEKARRQAVEDVMWAVLNTKEFLFNH